MRVRRLFPRAAVVNRQFRWSVRNLVAEERIHSALQLQKHLVGHHPPHSHARGVESLFYTFQNGFELRNLIFMFALAALDTLRGRQAPTTTHLAQTGSEPITRVLMMNPRVPVEVRVQERAEKEARPPSLAPTSQAKAVQALHHAVVRAKLILVPPRQVADTFHYLEPHLHSHRSLGQRTHQGLQRILRLVSGLVGVVVRVDAAQVVPGHQRPVRPNEHTIEIVADRQQLAQSRLVQVRIVLAHGQRHSGWSSFR